VGCQAPEKRGGVHGVDGLPPPRGGTGGETAAPPPGGGRGGIPHCPPRGGGRGGKPQLPPAGGDGGGNRVDRRPPDTRPRAPRRGKARAPDRTPWRARGCGRRPLPRARHGAAGPQPRTGRTPHSRPQKSGGTGREARPPRFLRGGVAAGPGHGPCSAVRHGACPPGHERVGGAAQIAVCARGSREASSRARPPLGGDGGGCGSSPPRGGTGGETAAASVSRAA